MTRNRGNQFLKHILISFSLYILSINSVTTINIKELMADFDLDDLFPGMNLKRFIPVGSLENVLESKDFKDAVKEENLKDLMPAINVVDLLSGNIFDIFKNGPALMSLFRQINKLKDWQGKVMVRAENYYRLKHPTSDGLLTCVSHLKGITNAFPNLWILPLLDASFKPPPGVLNGAAYFPGSFDQCRRYRTPKKNKLGLHFKGHYCSINFFSTMISNTIVPNAKVGICVPDSCGNDELDALLIFVKDIPMLEKVCKSITVTCAPDNYPFELGSIIVLMFYGFGFCFIVFATVYDSFLHRKLEKNEDLKSLKTEDYPAKDIINSKVVNAEKSPEILEYSEEFKNVDLNTASRRLNFEVINADKNREIVHYPDEMKHNRTWRNDMNLKRNIVLLVKASHNAIQHYKIRTFPWHCFSAIPNWKTIFDTSGSDGDLECIHGLRTLSMFWIILGHVYMCATPVTDNLLETVKDSDSIIYLSITSAYYAVDTFYTLSGFLLAYLTFKNLPNLTFKWIGYKIVHRCWRITPLYLVAISWNAAIVHDIGNGPFWDVFRIRRKMCDKYWWRNILYINNLFPAEEACVGIAWHIANDMQFFIISPIFIYVLTRRKTNCISGVTIMSLFLILASFIRGSMMYNADIWDGVITIRHLTSKQNFISNMYQKSYSRIGPYIVGYLFGYFQSRYQESVKLPQGLINFAWATAAITTYFQFYVAHDYPLGKPLLIIYMSVCRSIWSATVCWVIFASLNGYGGVVNNILAAKIWIPFSRLTYSAYFVHITIQESYYFNLKTMIHIDHETMFLLFVGFIAVTYTLSILVTLIFEIPLLKLEKHWFKKQ